LAGMKRKGFFDDDGKDIFEGLAEKKAKPEGKEADERKRSVEGYVKDYMTDYVKGVAPLDKPFVGAQPLLLRQPSIATPAEAAKATQVACRTLDKLIKAAAGIHIILAEDSRHSEVAKTLLEKASDEQQPTAPVVVSMANDWINTLPFTESPVRPDTGARLFVYIGTLGKYLSMCSRSQRTTRRIEEAYTENRLVILCRGVCMLPLGTQEQNIFGVEHDTVLRTVGAAARMRGAIAWGHGAGTKEHLMQKSFGYPLSGELPQPLSFAGDEGGSMQNFDYFVEYIKYLNLVKIARPSVPVTNWYDTGLLVSVLTSSVAEQGTSLLTDSDGLAMLREASIGHIISKLNQVITVEPYSSSKGVYNFFLGDGACRLNGGVELTMHLMEGYKASSFTTVFVFNNQKWAIEDNLVAGSEKEHILYNTDFYTLLQEHGNVCICDNDVQLRETLAYLSKKTDAYMVGKAKPAISLVVVRSLEVEMPPVLGDLSPIRNSAEMAFMREVLGKFAEGCLHKVPLYGCSAFEYIQYLHMFLEAMPEGKKYQYICGRTDIQAAHMCGFEQPEGKCVLFVNDVYGINSLGESLRCVLSGFGGRQLLLMVWHPSLTKVMDHFNLHRPPMVWPSVGPTLCKYYVRKESDAVFADFEGSAGAADVAKQVSDALACGTPLVVVNMLPEQEHNFVSLDIRVRTG